MTYKTSLRILIVFLLAVLIGYFFSFSEKYWLPLTAVLVMQAPVGSAVRRGIQIFLMILCVVVIYSFLFQKNLLYMRATDVIIGAAIGILANLILLPISPEELFRQKVIPVLEAYSDYLSGIMNLFLEGDKDEIKKRRMRVEKCLRTNLPDWVYESGFSIALRKGHTHFLIMIEKLGQILFSMQREARFSFNTELRDIAAEPFMHSVERAREMLAAIVSVLSLRKLQEGVEDFDDDIAELEAISQTILPASLELLEGSKEYLSFAGLVYDLRDLRATLLRLLQALR